MVRRSSVGGVPWASARSYHDNIVEHYENPRNVGSLSKDDKFVGTVSTISSTLAGAGFLIKTYEHRSAWYFCPATDVPSFCPVQYYKYSNCRSDYVLPVRVLFRLNRGLAVLVECLVCLSAQQRAVMSIVHSLFRFGLTCFVRLAALIDGSDQIFAHCWALPGTWYLLSADYYQPASTEICFVLFRSQIRFALYVPACQ